MVCLLILILIYEYLLTAIGLSPGGSSTVHIYTQTIHRTTQLTTLVGRLSGIRTQSGQTIINDNDKLTAYNLSPNWQQCGPCPVFASYILAFALQLRKKHGKNSVRVAEECQLARWKQNIQNRTYITIKIIYKINVRTLCVCVCVCKRMILGTVLVEGRSNSLSCPPASLQFMQHTVEQAGPKRFITLVMFCLMAYRKGNRLYVHKCTDYRVASLLCYWQAQLFPVHIIKEHSRNRGIPPLILNLYTRWM